jgi:RimJ/RimL family protein N-acetyltransferase
VPDGGVPTCSFETDRLRVAPWHRLAAETPCDLADVVVAVLTPATTADLPPDWQGEFDRVRAARWVADRDAEAVMLLVASRDDAQPIGIVALVADGESASPGVEVRLGYVLAEAAWGRGLATELVGGLLRWANAEPSVARISGGVSVDNPASLRVLTKQGFTVRATEHGVHDLFRDTTV